MPSACENALAAIFERPCRVKEPPMSTPASHPICNVVNQTGQDLDIYAGTVSSTRQRLHAARYSQHQRSGFLCRWLRLLRSERRRHGYLRRGLALAGCGQTGQGATDTQRRDGMGELRERVSDGRTRWRGRAGKYRGVGSRGLVSNTGKSPWNRHAGKCDHRIPSGLSTRASQSPLAGTCARGVQ